MDEGYCWKNMVLRLSISKAYTIPLHMQSHGLGMTPVSIQQLRATLRHKSIRTQNELETKLDGNLKTLVQTKSGHQQT
jgi:hypothetical protein